MKKYLVILVALLVALLACASVALADDVAEGATVDITKKDSITTIAGHDVAQWMQIYEFVNPTCTEKGHMTWTCNQSENGTPHYHTVYFNPWGHDWASKSWTGPSYDYSQWGHVKKLATCTEEGYAVDFCLECGVENPEVTRTIAKQPHVFTNLKKYEVVEGHEPTCTKKGLAYHVCDVCGYVNRNLAEAFELDYLPHSWTDFTVEKAPTCDKEGEASRVCTVCGAKQYASQLKGSTVKADKEAVAKYVTVLNPNWDKLASVTTWDELKKLGIEYIVIEDKLLDCFNSRLTIACPHCYKDAAHYVHKPVTLEFHNLEAHVWAKKANGAVDNPGYTEKQIRDPEFYGDGSSVKATCTMPGYDLYPCVYNGDPDVVDADGNPHGDVYKKVVIEPLGHDWDVWNLEKRYVKDGKEYATYSRYCKRCYGVEEKVEEYKATPATLVKDGDGYKYVIDGKDSDYTGFVTFEGGEFWLTKGKVDTSLNGLINCPGDKWYFFANGQVQKVTQMAEYAGQWFMIKNGELDISANGLYDYNGGKFAFAAGRLLKETNGIWQNPKDAVWYFLSQGQLQKYTGTATYDGATFELVDGVVVVK